MPTIVAPCDSVVRLANVITNLTEEIDTVFQHIRFEAGMMIATNRRFMVLEKIGDFEGVFYLRPDARLIDQCRAEAAFNGSVSITFTPELGYTVAKTALGFVHPDNLGYFPGATDFDRWREIVAKTKQPAKKSVGGMYWEADGIARLAASSPSGLLVFEERIETNRPTLIRDVNDYSWLGVFNPFSTEVSYQPATLPSWIPV